MNAKILNINEHPELKAFIDSEPPNIVISGSRNKLYWVRLSDIDGMFNITLFDAACIYGKIDHIRALYPYTEMMIRAISASNYSIYYFPTIYGHTATLQYLETHLTAAEIKKAVTAESYEAIRRAALGGHIATLQHLETHFTNAEKMVAVKANNYRAIRSAAAGGHIAMLQYLETHLTNAEKMEAVKADDYSPIRSAACGGHIAMLQYLETYLTDAEKIEAVKAKDYHAICWAAGSGHTAMLQYLETHLTDAEKIEAVKANNYRAIREAAAGGHIAMLQYLETHLTDAEKIEAVKADNYEAFLLAAKYGNTTACKHLETHLSPSEKKEAVKADSYRALRVAAHLGRMITLQHLETHLTNDEKREVVKRNNYEVIQWAGRFGQTITLQHLVTHLTNDEKREVVKSKTYEAIRSAARGGDIAMLQYLETHLTNDEKREGVKSNNYEAIRSAAREGHIAILQHLETHLTNDEMKEIVKMDSYWGIRSAAGNGHTKTLLHLETHLTNDEKRELVKLYNYAVIHEAARNGHIETLQHFFKIDIALAYMESHVHEWSRLVLPYVLQKLTSLRADKAALEMSNPNAVFNVSEEEARCLYYMARHFIRLNRTEYRENLLFLLEIPQVKQLAHTRLNDGQENELLRLAQATGNQIAAQLLLAIPAVNDLARTHNYYRAESRGELDLRALAANRESSMAALSQGEQQRLAQAIGHYEPLIKSAGAPKIMHDLREALKGRYEKRPAEIQKDNGETLTLPLEYSGFIQLELSDSEKKRAFEAYYQHKDHTALRYLSKPNDWMSPEASFVNVDNDHRQRWSTFEEYEPLIAMLYCAARDEHTPATDGFTLETRFEHFIDELAHIGRAHNWDKTRQNTNGAFEAYDDLGGDKPSCFSGVKRRLFQSVLGHPLLTILTEERVFAEVNEFARAHFLASITDANREAMLDALSKVIAAEDLTDNDKLALTQTDITKEKYDQFIELMNQKYGIQFTSEPRFLDLIQQAVGDRCRHGAHILNFSDVIQLLLAPEPEPEQASPTSISNMRSFLSSARCEASETAAESTKPNSRLP